MEGNALKNGAQFMETIGTFADHVQPHVDFCKRRNAHFTHKFLPVHSSLRRPGTPRAFAKNLTGTVTAFRLGYSRERRSAALRGVSTEKVSFPLPQFYRSQHRRAVRGATPRETFHIARRLCRLCRSWRRRRQGANGSWRHGLRALLPFSVWLPRRTVCSA